jgi:orotate phosphoribosyltransferase
MTETERLTALLARLSYKEGDFVLSSGARSTFYLDAKQVTYHAEGADLVGKAAHRIAKEFGAQAIGGLTMGADAIVVCAVYASALAGDSLTGFIVRKEPKGHGLTKLIEGVSPAGKSVALVDDVITSGASLLKAAAAVRDVGGTVSVAIGLVDREEGGGKAIEAAGIPFRAICTLSQVRRHYKGTGNRE